MSLEENKAIIRRVIEEVVNLGNLSIINEIFTASFVDRSSPDQPAGPEGVRAFISSVRTGFPDLSVKIDDLIAEGDKVVIRTTWQGTHQDTYAKNAPTGKQVSRTMIQIFRLADGKIVEEWNEGTALL
ncbi:MAG TPA: ester cyclase [Ktedonobacterales bacterium]|jgi:predicted ester cyclase